MKLAIVIGSTRPVRVSDRYAKWIYNEVKDVPGVDAELVDLRDYPMPFFDEAVSPRYNPDRQIDPGAKKWLDKIDSFSAYIFVTPEYNHSIPGVLKNALDYVTWEMQRKPVSVVSHGAAGGARAATDLKEVLNESRAVVLPTFTPLAISGAGDKFDESGQLSQSEKANPRGPEGSLKAMLKELSWYDQTLAAGRGKISAGLESA